jgi:hypothetical protein
MVKFSKLASLILSSFVAASCTPKPPVVYPQKIVQKDNTLLEHIVGKIHSPIQKPKKGFIESDDEHARLTPPVIKKGSVIYQHIEPSLATDGNQDIQVNMRSTVGKLELKKTRSKKEDLKVKFFLYAPDIFSPKVSVTRLDLDGIAIPSSHIHIRTFRPKEISINIEHLLKDNILPLAVLKDKELKIRMDAVISLGKYKKRESGEFGSFKNLTNLPKELKPFIEQKKSNLEDPIVQHYIKQMMKKSSTPLVVTKKAFVFTQSALDYYSIELGYGAGQAIEAGLGDCDDYTKIMVALLRGNGIPSRMNNFDNDGDIVGFRLVGKHAWPEIALPLKDGGFAWFISEPTWADDLKNRWDYFQMVDRKYLYYIGIYPQAGDGVHEISADIAYTPKGRFSHEAIEHALDSVHRTVKGELQAMSIRAKPFSDIKKYGLDSFLLSHAETDDRKFKILFSDNGMSIVYTSKDNRRKPLKDEGSDKIIIDKMRGFVDGLEKSIGLDEKKSYSGLVFYRRQNMDARGYPISQDWVKVSRYTLERFYDSVEKELKKTGWVEDGILEKLRKVNEISSGKNLYNVLIRSAKVPK